MSVEEDLRIIYEDLSRDLARRGFLCRGCGTCCQFSQFDHQLWLTQIELDYLGSIHGLRQPVSGGGCPYLEEGKCGARLGRALGCRVFFCSEEGLRIEGLHEIYMERIRELARKHNLELEYGEFIDSLRRAEHGRAGVSGEPVS